MHSHHSGQNRLCRIFQEAYSVNTIRDVLDLIRNKDRFPYHQLTL